MELDFKSIGTSILNPELMKKAREKFLAHAKYWEQLDKKKGNHIEIKNRLYDMREFGCELVIPRLLEKFFFLYLNKHQPSQQNKQLALNVARVFAVLCYQYYRSARFFNMIASFWVSPSLWDKFLVGRKAKERSIAILQEIGLIIKPYHFNRAYNPLLAQKNQSEPRVVVMYQFDLERIERLHRCVEAMKKIEKTLEEDNLDYAYDIDDIVYFIENDIWDFMDRIKIEKGLGYSL